MPQSKGRTVTVCSACLRASCWHGEFMCSEARSAGTREMAASDLDALGKEHPSHYSPEQIARVCGEVHRG